MATTTKKKKKEKKPNIGTLTLIPPLPTKKTLSFYAGYADDLRHAWRAIDVLRKTGEFKKVRRVPRHWYNAIEVEIELDGKNNPSFSTEYHRGVVSGVLLATRID